MTVIDVFLGPDKVGLLHTVPRAIAILTDDARKFQAVGEARTWIETSEEALAFKDRGYRLDLPPSTLYPREVIAANSREEGR